MEKFKLTVVDTASIKEDIEKSREERGSEPAAPEKAAPDIFRCVSLEAANVQLAKNHEGYSREAEGYKAYAVSYMLCQRYGVDVKGYDISRLDGVLQGQDPREEVPAALTDMRDTFKEMNGRMARAMGLTRASRQKEQER